MRTPAYRIPIGDHAPFDYSRDRERMFREFAKRRDLESIRVEYTNFSVDIASAMTLAMLCGSNPPTAFIYENETLSAASLHAITEWLLNTPSRIGRTAISA